MFGERPLKGSASTGGLLSGASSGGAFEKLPLLTAAENCSNDGHLMPKDVEPLRVRSNIGRLQNS